MHQNIMQHEWLVQIHYFIPVLVANDPLLYVRNPVLMNLFIPAITHKMMSADNVMSAATFIRQLEGLV